MARATKHRIDAVVRALKNANKLSIEMERLVDLQLRNQDEREERTVSKLAALLVSLGVVSLPAPAATDPAQQAHQGGSEAAATTSAAAGSPAATAAEAEQASVAPPRGGCARPRPAPSGAQR